MRSSSGGLRNQSRVAAQPDDAVRWLEHVPEVRVGTPSGLVNPTKVVGAPGYRRRTANRLVGYGQVASAAGVRSKTSLASRGV